MATLLVGRLYLAGGLATAAGITALAWSFVMPDTYCNCLGEASSSSLDLRRALASAAAGLGLLLIHQTRVTHQGVARV